MVGNFALLDLGTPELLIILAIVVVLFGGKKLPELTKSIGSSVRELRKAVNGEDIHEERRTSESQQEQKEA